LKPEKWIIDRTTNGRAYAAVISPFCRRRL